MRNLQDTIAAIATPKGEGGIAIVRVSGAGAEGILRGIMNWSSCKTLQSARLYHGYVHDEAGRILDEAMAVLFRAPKSYTREDVAEIQCHGGSFIADRILEEAVQRGARPAERGEFTYRAFANGRIDAAKAEAVMAIINAGGERAARAAARGLKEGVSSKIGVCRQRLLDAVTLIDAAADFPEEIDENVTLERVRAEAEEIAAMLKAACDRHYARMLNEGARVVIAGRPNVGKSSLMNALIGAERAIVTDIPGTTRDIISEAVSINGIKVTLTDTAGIRDTEDEIEKIGVSRAETALKTADCVVLVLNAAEELTEEDRRLLAAADERYIIIYNKTDLTPATGEGVSAKTGAGIRELTQKIYEKCRVDENDEKLMSLRHIDCAERALAAVERLLYAPDGAYLDLLREDATEALNILGEITGENVSDTVIDGIFERFCVGK